jgi:hypothetical protein
MNATPKTARRNAVLSGDPVPGQVFAASTSACLATFPEWIHQ